MIQIVWASFLSVWHWFTPDKIVAIATVVYAVVTVVMFREIRRQTEATRGQAEIAETAANAAKQSADAFVNSERPWVLLDWERSAVKIERPYLVAIEDRLDALASNCLFSMKNFGRTPAKVLSGKAVLRIGESPVEPPEIEIEKLDSGAEFVFIFPQGETRAGEARLPTMHVSKNDREAVSKGIKFLWLCGIFRYVDTFIRKDKVEPYVTTFCYLYETRTNASHPFWQLGGPQDYNRAT